MINYVLNFNFRLKISRWDFFFWIDVWFGEKYEWFGIGVNFKYFFVDIWIFVGNVVEGMFWRCCVFK